MSDKKILRTLLDDHKGRHNAVTQKQLADATNTNPSTLRSELRRLREERNIPIANLRDGYFVVNSNDELQEWIGHLNQEIESKRNTIEHTLEAWDEFDGTVEENPDPEIMEPTFECHNCNGDMTKSDRRYPEDMDNPLCKQCFGEFLMNGKQL